MRCDDKCPLCANSGHCQSFLQKFLLGVANSLNAHPFARIAPKLLDVLINERGIEQVGGGDPFVHESQILPEFELAADVGQI